MVEQTKKHQHSFVCALVATVILSCGISSVFAENIAESEVVAKQKDETIMDIEALKAKASSGYASGQFVLGVINEFDEEADAAIK